MGTGDVGEGTPDVVVLTETQRELPTQSLPGYVVASEAQNARCWLATAGALRWGRFFGGVAIAVRLGKGTLLAAEATKFYVVAAIRAHTGLAYVVGGVYIPPRSSCNIDVPYAEVMADLAEAVGRVQLAHAVPLQRVVLLGDWNANLAHLPCGVVDDVDLGDVSGPRGAPWYHGQRQTECTAVA